MCQGRVPACCSISTARPRASERCASAQSARAPPADGEGRTVDAKYYPQEGHGFVKRENQIDAIRRTIDWFDRYLKGRSTTAATK